MMACVQPVSVEDVEPLIERVAAHGEVSIANYNSPSQQVVAGDCPTVEALLQLCEDELFVEPIIIERSIPMHTPRFRPAAELLRPYLVSAPFRTPLLSYLPNVTAQPLEQPRPEDLVELLFQHVYSPVRWKASIDLMVERYPQAEFVEVGPGGVLTNLLQKRWHAVRKFKSDSRSDLAKNLGSLRGQLDAAP
jgi:malonyl CoA-acyl carrier protein transacylase